MLRFVAVPYMDFFKQHLRCKDEVPSSVLALLVALHTLFIISSDCFPNGFCPFNFFSERTRKINLPQIYVNHSSRTRIFKLWKDSTESILCENSIPPLYWFSEASIPCEVIQAFLFVVVICCVSQSLSNVQLQESLWYHKQNILIHSRTVSYGP
jgi:hypothetical protein